MRTIDKIVKSEKGLVAPVRTTYCRWFSGGARNPDGVKKKDIRNDHAFLGGWLKSSERLTRNKTYLFEKNVLK